MEHAQTFAIIQTMVNKEKATEAFESYKKIRFPWIESSKEKEKLDHIKKLMTEVKHGALTITPMAGQPVRSRIHAKVIDRRTSSEVSKEQAKIYTKIGATIPR